MAVITWVGMYAALASDRGLAWVLGWLAAGSTAACIGQLAGVEALNILGGWFFIISAIIAAYVASALMLKSAYGRTVLRTGEIKKPELLEPGVGEPGVLRGQ